MLSLKRDGDTFVFDGVINFTPDSDEALPKDADQSNIEVAITFPGTVIEHNGNIDGKRVSWNTSCEGNVETHAVASAELVGPPAWVWALISLGVLAVIAIIAIIVIVVITVVAVQRRRSATTT